MTTGTTDTFVGPIDFVVFVVRRGSDVSGAVQQLRDQLRVGSMTLLDVEVLALDEQGRAARQPVSVLAEGTGDSLGDLQSFESDLLDDDDLADLAAELGADELAVVLVYEDRSLAGVAEHLSAQGGRVLWAGGVHTDEIEQALELTKE